MFYDIRRSELKIRGGIEDNSNIIFLFLNENICCDPSLEPSRGDGSKNGSQNTFFNGEILLIIHKLFLLPLLIWTTEDTLRYKCSRYRELSTSISVHTRVI